MKKGITNFIEGVVMSAIVLVLVHTLLEDVTVLFGAPWTVRRVFIFTGFAFDLFFSIEFLIRSWNALSYRRFGHYFVHQNGWVDFIASVPLIMFSSAPELIFHLGGATFAGVGALMGMLKVVKAVRIARVLRLLRLLRLFQRIRFADSVMAQRHTVRIITTVAASFIFFNMIIGTAFTFVNSIDAEKSWVNEQQATMEYLNHMQLSNADSNAVENLGRFRPTILMIKERGEVLYARDSDSSLRTYFGPGDYMIRRAYPYIVWFDVRPVAVSHARLNVTVFLTTLAVILLLLITYSPHFALTVSDPVNVMTRGMKEKSYNFEVRIPRNYSKDETFRLAEVYNEEFLPMKERSDTGHLDISMDDISDLLKP